MTKRKISDHFAIDFGFNNPEWRRIRNSPQMDTYLARVGEEAISRCNADLHGAQAKRNQPVEDGYDYHITHGTRARLNIFPDTARAMAHEAVNQSILKSVPVGTMKGDARGPDHEVPRELAHRANEARERASRFDAQGNEIHGLDRP